MIHFIHAMDKDNPGDWWSSPRHYFADWRNASVSHVKDTQRENVADVLIYGGGDLLSSAPKHSTWMKKNLKNYKPKIKIAWGLGVDPKCRDQDLLQAFDLFGVRNHQRNKNYKNYNHVPCASCLHDEFKNISLHPTRDVGIIHHKKAMIPMQGFLDQFITNDQTYDSIVQSPTTIQKTVAFIKTSKTIISNSFHGCYWSLLCGVPVIAVDIHRHREKMSQIHPDVSPVRSKPHSTFFHDKKFLEYCQDQNMDFYTKVKYV